jgi:NitT/TauT family transport system substrate-binding protein
VDPVTALRVRRWPRLLALLTTMVLAACSTGTASTLPGGSTDTGSSAAPAGSGAPSGSGAAPSSSDSVVPEASGATGCKISVAFGLALGNSSNPFAWIGRDLGFFQKEGVDPDIISLNGDSARGDALLASGQLDVGIFGLEKVLDQAAAGTNLPEIAVYNVQNKSQYEGIVNNDSPIQALADLKGKKIGIPQLGATNETYVNAVIATVGLQPTDVTYVATGIGVPMGEALKSGQVDAAFSTRGQLGPIITGGYPVRFLPRPAFADQFITGNVVARSDLSADKVQCLKGYLRAYTESIVFSKANPQTAMLVNWHMFPDAVPTNVPFDQALKSAVDNYTAYMSYINKQNGKWGYMPAGPLASYVDYLGLTGKVDITKFYTNDYIDYANDFDETAIQTMAANYPVPSP